jgi:hypothetical protein
MRTEDRDNQHAWLENDLSRTGRLMADWRPWPPIIFAGVVLITVLFKVPLIGAVAIGAVGAIIMAVVGYKGEKRVAARIACTDSELLWIDRGGRTHRVHLSQVQEIKRLPRQAESVIWYSDEKGEPLGLGVGPKAAETVRKTMEAYWSAQGRK